MTGQLSNSEFESLINDGELSLAEQPEAATNSEPVVSTPSLPQQDLSFFGKIPVHVTLEVASVEVPLQDLLAVDVQSVIALDKLAGEPLDVKVNGAPFAKAEVVVLNGNYGLRILELIGNGLAGLKS
ncbi:MULTISPECIES: flagellar motor switch protein FliN [Pseudomonas]|jgi:flagellar motor switch protein FliN/FliY|uniref:Flagellar motor switch protein FliN n=1 Tax=Serpens gallinarum TaxID=2763075 RepID=A0ABR8TLS1_9PSED|nr:MULTISPECIES: flagellar motor switch protein FliN [Pseudomonas]MBD7976704.1 flagellar motor switch protein FliN [Serpens gallinarum]MBF0676854.1 flagellar motor switch protein FliN [Pseudomonas sp.]